MSKWPVKRITSQLCMYRGYSILRHDLLHGLVGHYQTVGLVGDSKLQSMTLRSMKSLIDSKIANGNAKDKS